MTARDLRRQEEQGATRAVRRLAAVSAATELFAQRGFHATAMADVAKVAGLSLKSLYAGFSSKEALFEAVLVDVGARFSDLLEPPDRSAEPARWVLGFVDHLVELLAANSSALRLYARGADGIPAALRDRGVDPFAGFLDRIVGLLAEAIRDAQSSGDAPHVDAMVLARGILTLAISESRHRLETGRPVAEASADLSPIVAALLRK